MRCPSRDGISAGCRDGPARTDRAGGTPSWLPTGVPVRRGCWTSSRAGGRCCPRCPAIHPCWWPPRVTRPTWLSRHGCFGLSEPMSSPPRTTGRPFLSLTGRSTWWSAVILSSPGGRRSPASCAREAPFSRSRSGRPASASSANSCWARECTGRRGTLDWLGRRRGRRPRRRRSARREAPDRLLRHRRRRLLPPAGHLDRPGVHRRKVRGSTAGIARPDTTGGVVHRTRDPVPHRCPEAGVTMTVGRSPRGVNRHP